MFNPILGAANARSNTTNDEDRQEFFDKVAQLSDEAHDLNTALLKLNDTQSDVSEQINTAYSPVEEMAVRAVQSEELIEAKEKLGAIQGDIAQADEALAQKVPLVAELQRAVKELADTQIEARLSEADQVLEELNK